MSTKIKPLLFKGDKPKKRKRRNNDGSSSKRQHLSDDDEGLGTEDSSGEVWTVPPSIEAISGPLLIVFPQSPPLALTSDATGAIFTTSLHIPLLTAPTPSQLPMIVAKHAVPQEGRQVFVAATMPYTSTAGAGVNAKEKVRFSLRNATGKYVGAGKSGFLSAEGEAIGAEEEWEVVRIEESMEDDDAEEPPVEEDSDDVDGPPLPPHLAKHTTANDSEDELPQLSIHDDDADLPAPSHKPSSVMRVHSKPIPTRVKHSAVPTFALRTIRGTYLTLGPPAKASASSLPTPVTTSEEPVPLILRMQRSALDSALAASQKTTSSAGMVVQMTGGKISRDELVKMVGREVDDDEAALLRRAAKKGGLQEAALALRVKGKRDKFAW